MTELQSTNRKERLAALAARAGRSNGSSEPESELPTEARDKVVFRNYQPRDISLQETREKKIDDEQPLIKKKRKLEDALEMAQLEVTHHNAASDIANSSQKINWDLKRDIVPQINRLEKRTQQAIVELLKERLAREASEEGLQSNLD
mmetsp:Transcript_3045/g.4615  ORF Transcript_3045/g.4615 Transcript_3045/m.4615 type:complete len:147 (-) Transcript_3045:997-1437(-)